MMNPTPAKINLLPEHIIDQIKAGEVIERPGNLVKEIIENSLDAQSTKIELIIKNNGLDQISIKDNGIGISHHDLPLAFSRHATSKLSNFDDLYKLSSFGFRGEALASISSIAKIQCLTQTIKDDVTSEIKIDGGQTLFYGKRSTSLFEHGTEIVIRDLFFNTPARLKFIQSQQSEKNYLKKIIFSFILSYPEVEFTIKFDDKEKEIFTPQKSISQRINHLFPKLENQLIHIHKEYDSTQLDIFFLPDKFKNLSKIQYAFINNRLIFDKQIQRILINSIKTYGGEQKYQYLILFQLPPDAIDVNVHPSKTIIKILENSKAIALLTASLKEVFKNSGTSSFQKSIESKNEYSTRSNSFYSNQQMPSTSHELSTLPTGKSQDEGNELSHGQKYNFEGIFSPHFENESEKILRIDDFLIIEKEKTWLAIEAVRLLKEFCLLKLQSKNLTSIPLLVSEPYSTKGLKKERIHNLIQAGFELEYLGEETLVLRSIPDWMNKIPLKSVTQQLLSECPFANFKFQEEDFSDSSWKEILSCFSTEDLLAKKIAFNLHQLLREKIK